jgi:hypothetical protein
MHRITEFNENEWDLNAVAWQKARCEAVVGLHAGHCKA